MASKSKCEVLVAAYGPKALQLTGEVGDGFILQLADIDIAAWTIDAVRKAARDVGRDPKSVKICVAAPAYVGDDLAHMREQCRWFGGMVGNHVADIVSRYGDSSSVPAALTDYIKGRQGYDYKQHGQAGNTHTTFVPDAIVDRFCILGKVDEHLKRLKEFKKSVLINFRFICNTMESKKPLMPTANTFCQKLLRDLRPLNNEIDASSRISHVYVCGDTWFNRRPLGTL